LAIFSLNQREGIDMMHKRRDVLKAAGALGALAVLPKMATAAHHRESLKGKADSLLQAAVDAGDVPGVVAMATNRQGLIYEGAFGTRQVGANVPMSLDTVVWIASMTKALTGAAAMQQVERGKLQLDTPAHKILPQLKESRVLTGFDADGQPMTRAPKRDVTLRHLLTHTSGHSYDIWNKQIGEYMKVKNVPGIISCQNAALTTPLVFDPGERWEYGTGIDFAGKMVEAVSGQKLGDYMRDNLLLPLGMNSSAFKITDDMRSRLSRMHARTPDGLVAIDFEIPQAPEFEMGGGGMYSTVGDYLKFVQMMLNSGKGNGNQVLKPSTVALMSKNAMGKIRVTMLKPAGVGSSNDAEFFPGLPKGWGLSFMTNEAKAPTGRSAGSLAWAGLANSFYWIDQKKGVAGVLATQILPFADVKALPLFEGFETAVYHSLA
jgi:CubicO group peptidase (beta-lactamase class C family)